MYNEFFQFRVKPFELLPNPDFLYPSKPHRKALAHLEYGLGQRSGFILLTGDVGAGKTTLIRNLLKQGLQKTVISKVFNPRVDPAQLMAMINDDFGLPTQGKDKVSLIRELNDFLINQFAAGNRCVLIIDEAQNLSGELLEEVRLLSNLETDSAKLLQIILVGQPELRDILTSPSLSQLRQRILVQCHLPPLSREETEEYILHRLERAGNREALLFSQPALDCIHGATRGVPRLINIVCDYVLLDAFTDERNDVDDVHVQGVLDEMEFEQQFWPVASPADPSDVVQSGQTYSTDGQPHSKPAQAQRQTAQKTNGAAQRMMQHMRDLNSRIDFLEQSQRKFGAEEYIELYQRVQRLEQRLTLQVQLVDRLRNEQRSLLGAHGFASSSTGVATGSNGHDYASVHNNGSQTNPTYPDSQNGGNGTAPAAGMAAMQPASGLQYSAAQSGTQPDSGDGADNPDSSANSASSNSSPNSWFRRILFGGEL